MNSVAGASLAPLTLPSQRVLPSGIQSLADPTPPEPTESFGRTVTRNIAETAVDVGNMTGRAMGGMLGIASVTAGLYVGVAGGAIFLGLFGGGLGPVVAAVTNSGGLLNFVGTSFRTAGFFAQAGMVMGGAACAVGGWKVGKAVGNTVGTLPGMAIGAVIGAGKGVVEGIRNKAEEAAQP